MSIGEIKKDAVYKFDQFFTRPAVAQQCVDFLLQHCSWNDFDLVIEPAAGTGSFYNLFPADKRLGIELDERLCQYRPEYRQMSFLDYNSSPGKIGIVSNPPFGTQNNTAVAFFNHAAAFADTIAFIIPKTWKKLSIQNRLDLNFSLVANLDLPSDPFTGGKHTDVRCCFQVWKRTAEPRTRVILPTTHRDWDFLPWIERDRDLFPPEEADFSMLAYGSTPGQISECLTTWRPKSVHFIRARIGRQELMDRFVSLDYRIAEDSARQSSLGRGELVRLYTERFQ